MVGIVSESALVDDRTTGRIVVAEDRGGGTTLREQVFLARLVAQVRPSAIFEFGTHLGRSTTNMAVNMPTTCELFTLDLPADGVSGTLNPLSESDIYLARMNKATRHFEHTALAGHITRLEGDSARIDLTMYRGRIDLVYVDAAHTAEYVLNDSLAAMEMLRPSGGVIVWHDYRKLDGVTEVIDRLAKRDAFAKIVQIAGTCFAVLDSRMPLAPSSAPRPASQSGVSAARSVPRSRPC